LIEIAHGRRKAIKIRNKHTYDTQGNKLPAPDVVSQTVGGIDEATGKIFISVVEKDKPMVKFTLNRILVQRSWMRPTRLWPMQTSPRHCGLSKVKFLKELYPMVMTRTYEHPERKPPPAGGYGGGQ